MNSTFPPCIFTRLARYGVYLPSVMNQSQGMIFIEIKIFQTKVWLWVCVWKILVSKKKSYQDWGHNRGQVYAIPCFLGQYIGWKSILHPEKIGFINNIDYLKKALGMEKFPYGTEIGTEERYITPPLNRDRIMKFDGLLSNRGRNNEIRPVSFGKH